MGVIVQAVLVGMLVAVAGTIPRNIAFAANLRYFQSVPWAVPVTAGYLWLFWRYLDGVGPPHETADGRRASLRASRVDRRVWGWALLTGGLGIAALVIALRLLNRMVALPSQQLPNLSNVPAVTVVALLLMAAPVAGIVEEAAFRGYMQGPIERRYGLAVAILITGTMFAVAHLDFTPILWPYYVAVAALYGSITHITGSILPAVVLHTAGNLYSNFDLWWNGQAEWQAPADATALVWTSGPDASFWGLFGALLLASAAAAWAFRGLVRAARTAPDIDSAVTAGA